MKFRLPVARCLTMSLLAGGGLFLWPTASRGESAADWINRGNRYYAEERYPEAIEAYRHALELDPTSPVIQYNLGTALARSGLNEEGAKALSQSTQSAEAPLQKRDAWFNLGVAEAEPAMQPGGAKGEAAFPADPQEQIVKLRDAVNAFRQAILADPDDIQAKHNYELTLELLDRLNQQQQQDQQQEKSDKNEDQQDQQDQQDQKQDKKDPQEKDEQNGEQQEKQEGDQQQQEKQDEQQQEESGDQQQDNQQQDQQDGQKDSQPREEEGASQDKGLEQDRQEQESENKPPAENQPQPASPQEAPDQSAGGQAGSAGEEPQLTPEQMNALRILNLLEKEKPEQFKELFRFKGAPSHQLEKDW